MASRGFARSVEAVEPSHTLAIDARAKALRLAGKDVVGFGAGEPDFDTPAHVKEAACRAIAEGRTKYTPVAGIPALREAVARKLAADNGVSYRPDEIVVSCGAKHALYNAIRVLLNPGDEALILSPHWVTYPAQVILAGGNPVFVAAEAADGFRIDPERVEAAVTPRTRLIIVNSPNNPTGWVAERDELAGLAEIALRHRLHLISDEIYEKIVYPPAAHLSIASLGPEIKECTIVVNGVSKSHAMTGWRIGYLAASRKIAALAERLQSHCTSNPDSIAQAAAVEALGGDRGFVEMMLRSFQARRDLLVGRLAAMPGVRCAVPRGAFYAFPDISSFGVGSAALAEELLEKALVAVVPGAAFGADAHLRLSYATSTEQIEKGMDRMERFLRSR
ncbi:MAG: pyridoxal phosphate-dependent aminotransferase [Chlamydiae bacterium]|nr:pyridoxal phosphate-dependent aminotransferase [Chlamydiota bacterium]